jgi:hypothetical protein
LRLLSSISFFLILQPNAFFDELRRQKMCCGLTELSCGSDNLFMPYSSASRSWHLFSRETPREYII